MWNAKREILCTMARSLILLAFSIGNEVCLATAFANANAPGAIGETSNLFLLDRGIFARPFYNDVFGKTDKHLSGATQLSYMHPGAAGSLELRTNWRLITPSFKEKFSEQALAAPVGRYADWLEMSLAWSQIFETQGQRWRIQLSAAYGHIGDHGGKELHRRFHEMIGSSLEGLEYTNQPLGTQLGCGFEIGIIDEDSHLFGWKKESMLTIGLAQNRFMSDVHLTHNQILSFDRDRKLAMEVRSIRQVASEVYGSERLDWRYEMTVGMRWKWYRPSVKFVSPFLRRDQVGQMYFDPLAFEIEW